MKIDVEGHEFQVLHGGHELLNHYRPSLLVEVCGGTDGTPAFTVFRYLARLGYSACFYDGERLRRRRPGDISVNYFFLQSSHIRTLRDKGWDI
jgi:hypothetical protein